MPLSREKLRRELDECAEMLLAAMEAEKRMYSLDPKASSIEAQELLSEAENLRQLAMEKFRLLCVHAAIAVKG